MRGQIADSVGSVLAMTLFALPLGCAVRHDSRDLQPWIAVTGLYSISSQAVPAPPAPPAGEKCPTCSGRGWLGDSVTRLQCSDCGGTGLRTKSVLVTPDRCKDGRCKTPATVR